MERVTAAMALLLAACLNASARDIRDLPYKSIGSEVEKLDVLFPEHPAKGNPVMVFIHGGGWVAGDKAEPKMAAEYIQPWLDRGFAVVSANYRLADAAKAPAAAEDASCAVRWAGAHRAKYGWGKVYLSGISAGAHLAMLAGMSDGFGEGCKWPEKPPIMAIVNFYGFTDLMGYNDQFTRVWLKDGQDRGLLSPVAYVKGSAPIITVHGTADQVIHFGQAEALTKALKASGIRARLIPIKDGGHGQFTASQNARAWCAIDSFLEAM